MVGEADREGLEGQVGRGRSSRWEELEDRWEGLEGDEGSEYR